MANTDLRVKRFISPRSGSVYDILRCPSFTSCLSTICYVPGSELGCGDSRINQTWSLPVRIHKPVGKRDVLTDSWETVWEGLLELTLKM